MTTLVFLTVGTLLCTYQLVTVAEISNDESSSEDTLQAAFIIFRHGDRNPVFMFPTDPYINYSWPGGYGALTTKGSLQAFNLGQRLRQKYASLLPNDEMYSKIDLQVFSSDVERTIMSAESVLAGLLPPPENKNLLPIKWQPVPVHIIPKAEDNIIAGTKSCPRYLHNLIKLLKNPPKDYLQMINHYTPNQNVYEYLSEHVGFNVTNFVHLLFIYDSLRIEQLNDFELREWTRPVLSKKMQSIIERVVEMFTENFEMKRIRAGPLITEIVKAMSQIREIVNNNTENHIIMHRKLFLFSGHDLTLISLIRALGIDDQTFKIPEYASALSFEIHKNELIEDELEVKLFFCDNSDTEEPQQVHIPNCHEPCNLNKFAKAVSIYFVSNYEKICKIRESTGSRFVKIH